MPAPRKYPAELIERGVQLVIERKQKDPGRAGIIREVGELLGIHPEVLRHWVNKAISQSDQSAPDIRDDSSLVRRLEKENAELRRINAILKAAAVLFAAEIGPGASI